MLLNIIVLIKKLLEFGCFTCDEFGNDIVEKAKINNKFGFIFK